MSTTPLPDYFELLRQMSGMATAGGAAGATPAASANIFDPVEIDKKIRDLQIVHMWLEAQTNAVALSVKALEYQRDTIATLKTAGAQTGNVDFAQAAKLFDPAAWMQQAMDGLNASVSASTPAPATSKPPRAKKK
jgi:hypothetical protein